MRKAWEAGWGCRESESGAEGTYFEDDAGVRAPWEQTGDPVHEEEGAGGRGRWRRVRKVAQGSVWSS